MSAAGFAPAAERARRLLARARRTLGDLPRRLRPWARPQAWNAEGRRAALSALRRHPRRSAGLAGAVLALAGLPLLLTGDPARGIATARVAEGPFRVAIVEAGTLQALRSYSYASTIQSNQAKIVALAPEGKLVQKGDLLILFDAAPFEEEIRTSQARLAEARADLEKARQDFTLQRIENEEQLATASQKLEHTALELKDVQEGKGRLKEEEAAAAVAQAERELKKARTSLEDLEPLLAEGFITKLELERAQQQVAKAAEELELARRRHESLVRYGRPLELSQARADALRTRDSFRQLQAAVEHRLEQKRAAIAAAQSRIDEAGSKLALARQQLERTEVRADVPGIVVYREVFFGSEQRRPQVGDQVWANQPLLILPNVAQMVVETRVRETDIHKIEQNQKVRVRVEAYPDLRLSGAVTLVGTLAQEERERRGAKFFGVTVQVNESDPRLRPGMSARVEIQVEERANALSVPLDAVFERDGRTFCFVVEGRRLRQREVVIGPSNQDHVVIEKGLRRGDRVCLRDPGAPPSDFGALTAS